ncbi:T9SS type A sorting domain-containing protein [Microvirga sp. STR05]|uniref:T9SS type A sorting domain-containing protein n=1 Tax=Hymenobacter duratus TaxID=2771356 RepID=A0ABR8JFB5_9BACT|nr:T9SS type A sorting domain-containing protein [Hymenobacter duratus]MBD2715549.1 T9SS type A sorting domain-containing protein [Hymenobacter duratus]MBR7950457.1 T9SS type A sorting domain-containing protein [Microvirga sp. STR05]
MKATALPRLLLLLLFVFCTAASASAAKGHRRGFGPANPELKAYLAQNVLPAVRQQRQKLEPQLSTADRAQLAIYRIQLKEIDQKMQTLRQSIGATSPAPPPPGTRPALPEALKQQVQQVHTEHKTLMQNVSQLAQKYAGDIARLSQELQPQKEKWAADMKALVLKNATPEQQEKMGQMSGRLHRRAGANRFFNPAMFLLMDPNAPVSPAVSDLGSTSVYPNPAVATSQLEYEVKKAGPVMVELLDGRGNALRTVATEAKQEKGQHTVQVNISELPAGTYFYKITTRSGSETRRFVKE